MPIAIASLSPEHVGRWVRYSSGVGQPEIGRIKSWNAIVIWVVYKCAGQWDNFQSYTGNATDPKDLELLANTKEWRP
ncbi:MAG TPA: hypothetical protein VFU31_21115 [Candidatus Binatia bacterium]|nr:hypothetical protein [Candidatus Binatia bacterium]